MWLHIHAGVIYRLIWGVFCKFKLAFILCLSHCGDVCNVISYWISLYVMAPDCIKTLSYECRNSYHGDKIILASAYLHDGMSYTDKMVFFNWNWPWYIKSLCRIDDIYRKVSNISGTKSQNLNASRLILQLYLPNPLKPGVKSRMKM